MALVDGKLRHPLLAGVLVGLADDPSGDVAGAEIEDLARDDEAVEDAHDLGDGGSKVPPVDVEQVDVSRLQFFQTGLEGETQALGRVAYVVRFDSDGSGWPGRGEFGSEDDLVAVLAGVHPFAEPLLRLFALVLVGGVNEVAAVFEKEVEHRKGGFFVAFA